MGLTIRNNWIASHRQKMAEQRHSQFLNLAKTRLSAHLPFVVLIFKFDWASFNVPLGTLAFCQLIKNVRRNPLEFSNNKVKNPSLTQKFPAKSANLADLAG